MKNVNVLAIIFLLCQAISAIGQEIGVSIGYGTYTMSGLKPLNKEIIDGRPDGVQMDLVSNFPGYLTFGGRFSAPMSETFELGGDVTLYSTGSRAAYSDYSGHTYFDQRLHAIGMGVIPALIMVKNERGLLSLEGRTGMTFTQHTISSILKIGNTEDSADLKFRSINYFIEPALRFRRTLTSSFSIGLRMGYHLPLVKGKLYFVENSDAFLLTPEGDATADWSGIRADLSVNYNL